MLSTSTDLVRKDSIEELGGHRSSITVGSRVRMRSDLELTDPNAWRSWRTTLGARIFVVSDIDAACFVIRETPVDSLHGLGWFECISGYPDWLFELAMQ